MSRIGRVKFFDDLQVQLHDGDAISECIHQHSVWEEGLSLELLRIAADGGTLVDVGANIGYFAMLWAKAKPGNEVLAFEASPRIYPQLVSNITLNRLTQQVHCMGTALGETNQICTFVLGPEEQTGWGGLMDSPNEAHCKVVCVRLDQVLDQDIRLLKIDVEGADTLVLKGCDGLLRTKKIKEIFFEQNLPRMAAIGVEAGDAQRYLESMGYRVELFVSEAGVSEWRAWLE